MTTIADLADFQGNTNGCNEFLLGKLALEEVWDMYDENKANMDRLKEYVQANYNRDNKVELLEVEEGVMIGDHTHNWLKEAIQYEELAISAWYAETERAYKEEPYETHTNGHKQTGHYLIIDCDKLHLITLADVNYIQDWIMAFELHDPNQAHHINHVLFISQPGTNGYHDDRTDTAYYWEVDEEGICWCTYSHSQGERVKLENILVPRDQWAPNQY